MLRRLQRWSRLHVAVLVMFASAILLGLSAPCVAGPMGSALPMAAMPADGDHGDHGCCDEAPMPSQAGCPIGCRALAPEIEPPAPPFGGAAVLKWNSPAKALLGLAPAPDDPPPR